MQVSKIFSGHCPELNRNCNIRVNFAEINILGENHSQYKKTGFSCEHGSNYVCKTENSRDYSNYNNSGCPIFNRAHYS